MENEKVVLPTSCFFVVLVVGMTIWGFPKRATTKKRRKLIRGRKKKKGDNAKEKEGVTYATGSGSFL